MTILADPTRAAQLAARLRTRTRRLPPLPAGAPDLVAAAGTDGPVWMAGGRGVAGRGVALRLALPAGLADRKAVAGAAEALACLHWEPAGATDGPDGGCGGPRPGPVALGALPFDRHAPAELVVPRVLLTWDGEQAWVTTTTAGDPAGAERLAADVVAAAAGGSAPGGGAAGRAAARQPAPDGFELRSARSHEEWRGLVAAAVSRIRDGGPGGLRKVVLARRVDVAANGPLPTDQILERLAALYPTCMVFRVGKFLGASPELLVRRRGPAVASHPLAGTVARSGSAAADRSLVDGLMASAKDRAEHAFVIDELRARLAPWCEELHVPERPSVLELRNVSHLETRVSGRLRSDLDRPSALELVAALHPTPAVAGTPADAACAYLREVEGFDRGPYAGPVGWVDPSGDGDWALGIRSAVVDGTRAELYAGVGVVAGSDPDAELAETQLKLQALLAAVVRP